MSVVAPHDADAPGTLVARGATAVVYRVDDQLGGHVAWKISRGGAAINEAFVSEVDMMKLVGSHPHIVALHHFDFAHNLPTLVQEYAAGGDLLSGLCNSADLEKPIPTMVVKKIAVQLLLAVQHVHRAGVLHRDIKLENLLLRFPCPAGRLDLVRDGHVHLLLADFGFACREASTGHIKCSGTFCTMSPECLRAWQDQRRGGVIAERYSFPSDVWSVGVVLLEIFTQKRQFVGKDYYETRARVENFELSKACRDRVLRCVPLEARDLVTNLLCPDPAKRITVEKALNHPWLQGALLNLAEHVHVEDLRHWSQATTTALVDQQPETTSPDTFHLLPPSESVVEQSPAVQRVEKHKKLATPDHVSALDAIADTLKELDA